MKTRITVFLCLMFLLAGCLDAPAKTETDDEVRNGQPPQTANDGLPLGPVDYDAGTVQRIGPIPVQYEIDHPGTKFWPVKIPPNVDFFVIRGWIETLDAGHYWVKALTNPTSEASANGIDAPAPDGETGDIMWSMRVPDLIEADEAAGVVVLGPEEGKVLDPEPGWWRLWISGNGNNVAAFFEIDFHFAAEPEDEVAEAATNATERVIGPDVYRLVPPSDPTNPSFGNTFEVPTGTTELRVLINASAIEEGPYFLSGSANPEDPFDAYGVVMRLRAEVGSEDFSTGIQNQAGNAEQAGHLVGPIERAFEHPEPGPWAWEISGHGENVEVEVTLILTVESG